MEIQAFKEKWEELGKLYASGEDSEKWRKRVQNLLLQVPDELKGAALTGIAHLLEQPGPYTNIEHVQAIGYALGLKNWE